MSDRKQNFLVSVIGPDGSKALSKATASSPDLTWALLPRVILSWLEASSHADYHNQLPGVADTTLSFKKSESSYTGSINIGKEIYAFRDVSLDHVAGSIAIALGADPKAPTLNNSALAKLGKSIDLITRSRTLRKMQAKAKGGGAGGKGPGPAAGPQAPMLPTPPTSVQAAPGAKDPNKAAVAAPTGIKLPGVKAKKPTLAITKAEASRRCPACGGTQFCNGFFRGCLCFEALADSVKTTEIEGAYVLSFGSDWDRASVATLAESLK